MIGRTKCCVTLAQRCLVQILDMVPIEQPYMIARYDPFSSDRNMSVTCRSERKDCLRWLLPLGKPIPYCCCYGQYEASESNEAEHIPEDREDFIERYHRLLRAKRRFLSSLTTSRAVPIFGSGAMSFARTHLALCFLDHVGKYILESCLRCSIVIFVSSTSK